MRARLWKWHRRLGLLACAALLLWGVSGALHPFMSALQPRAHTSRPPQSALSLTPLLAPVTVLERNGISRFSSLRLLSWEARATYQVMTAGQLQYYDAVSGVLIEAADHSYAHALAAHYLGPSAVPVTDARQIDAFEGEYTEVNRLLPVWRLVAADGRRLYIHTPTSRLASVSDDRKAVLSWLFVNLHNANWLPGPEWLRVGAMLCLLLPVLAAALSGLVVYGTRLVLRSSAAGSSWRRWHRRVGLLVSLALLSAAASGILHLLMMSSLTAYPIHDTVPRFDSDDLRSIPWPPTPEFEVSGLQLARVDDVVAYRLSGLDATPVAAGHHHNGSASHAPGQPAIVQYWRGQDVSLADGELQHARTLARAFSELPDDCILDMQRVSQFGGEYGFINKLLPVWRVAYHAPGNPRYYVDTASGRLAARVDDTGALEGWIFAYLHKWEWLKPLGKTVQNTVTVLVALAYIGLGLLGIGLYRSTAQAG